MLLLVNQSNEYKIKCFKRTIVVSINLKIIYKKKIKKKQIRFVKDFEIFFAIIIIYLKLTSSLIKLMYKSNNKKFYI